MDNILPLILETLNKKPHYEVTEKDLYKDVQQKLKNINLGTRNFKKNFDQAIEVGEDLGIIRLFGEETIVSPTMKFTKCKRSRSKSVSQTPSTSKKRKFDSVLSKRKSDRIRGRRRKSRG